MSARSKARRRALDILFEAEQRNISPIEALQGRREKTDTIINEYSVEIIEGVMAHGIQIDEFLSTYSQGWTLDRMPAVDRMILRVGSWELLYNADVPDTVAVSEALHLVQELSTDDSPAFVNGLLGAVMKDRASLV